MKRPIDILILNALVVTLDAQETIIDNGAVAIDKADIVAVGSTAELQTQFAAQETIDAANHLLLPGLINTHCHAPDALFRGLIDDLPLEPWLERLWQAEKRFIRPDTVRLGAQLAYAEMIRGGITTALDMFWFPEVSAAVAKAVGFRLLTGPIYFDFSEPDNIPVEERTARGREFLQQYQNDPLITPCVLPHSAYTVSPQYLAEAQALADEFGVLLSTHASETMTEVDTIQERYDLSPIAHLDDLRLLTERTVVAHAVHLSQADIEQMAKRRAVVAHCPLSNLKLGSGIAPLPRMQQAGIRTTLGTDGPVSGNDLDLWLTMRLAATLPKGVQQDPSLCPALDILKMATCDAAEALGLGDRLGSLEAGKRADLILIDLNRPHLTPLYDVYSHLIYSVGRADVSTVIINGQMVMRARRLTTLDEAAIMNGVRSLTREIAPMEM